MQDQPQVQMSAPKSQSAGKCAHAPVVKPKQDLKGQDDISHRVHADLCAVDSKEGCQHSKPHHLLLRRQALLALPLHAEVAFLPQQRIQIAVIQNRGVLAYALT